MTEPLRRGSGLSAAGSGGLAACERVDPTGRAALGAGDWISEHRPLTAEALFAQV